MRGRNNAEVPSQSPIDQVRQEGEDWVPPGDAWGTMPGSAYRRPNNRPRPARWPCFTRRRTPQASIINGPPSRRRNRKLPAHSRQAPVISSRPPLPTENPWVAADSRQHP